MNQLRKDLEKRINERLHQWIEDSVSLYEMAGLPSREALVDIYTQLCYTIVGATVAFDIPKEQLIEHLDKAIDRRMAKRKED